MSETEKRNIKSPLHRVRPAKLTKRKNRRMAALPNISYSPSLPITAMKNEIVKAIKNHSVVIITGETGSGKTTQIPKMCLEAGRGIWGMIGSTQPRRVAAVMVAHRIAEEFGEEIGNSVGYKIRFEERSKGNPFIKIMTDGIMLMEAQSDPLLRAYDTIIVDEAHERSLNIDFLLGILKNLLQKRNDLKVIITSATIDTEKFSLAFNHAPIIEVSGRMYPVDVRYTPIEAMGEEDELSYVEAAVKAVEDLIDEGHREDILIFMPTERDIRETCDLLAGRSIRDCIILPMFARLSWSEQQRVFQSMTLQKIVVATNVAETSITIPGIHYVIDTGLARISQYNPRSRTASLPIRAISQSSSEQRKGRCGRVEKGICIRLYEEEDYKNRPIFTQPEILRSNLADAILRMISLNLQDISSFPFIDPPNSRHIKDAVELLQELGAIRVEDRLEESNMNQLALTERGRLMSRMPLDPRISRMIIEAEKEDCVDEIIIIAAALSIQDPRERPADEELEADRVQEIFKDPSSDFLTLLNIWKSYHRAWDAMRSGNKMRRFCQDNFLSYKRMRDWQDVHDQISEIISERRGGKKKKPINQANDYQKLYAPIHRSILSGFLSNIAVKKEKNIYTATKGRQAMIFPGSGLFNKGGNWIVAAEMIETSRLYARRVAVIEMDWLEELGGNLCRSSFFEPHWEKNRGEVVAYEQVSLFGLVILPRRPVSYGRIDPDKSSQIFIRHALVAGEIKIPPPFLLHNQRIIQSIADMEDKIRRHDLLVNEETIARFYEDRLPGIYDVRTLQKYIRDRGGDFFLRMREEDVVSNVPDFDVIASFPDEVKLGAISLPCTYRFDPGKPDDGASVTIPDHLIPAIPATSLDWLIPGLLKNKIFALIKGLPKEYRKKLQPIAQTCHIINTEMQERDGLLISALGKFIYERFGINIPASAWSLDTLEDHFTTRAVVVDAGGRVLTSTRNIGLLQKGIMEEGESRIFADARKVWEKEGLTVWDFGDMPELICLGDEESGKGYAFPGLKAGEECVNIRLFKTKPDAELSHRRGVVTLYAIHFKDELKYLKKALVLSGEVRMWVVDFCGIKKFEKSVIEKVMRDLFCENIRSKDAFICLAEAMGPRILPRGQEVLQEVKPILRSYHETGVILLNLEKANKFNRPALRYLSDLKQELNRLLPHNFLEVYSCERYKHLTRYFKALALRAERGLIHLEKAFLKSEEVKTIVNQFADVLKDMSPYASEEKRKAVEEYFWMIEEYKVSLFAQELKTAFPISRKRLEQKLQEILNML